MCLIVFAWHVIPDLPLIAVANRDEFFDRPAAPASWWNDHPEIYAGRDLQGGGTWMGVTRNGHFAAVTNVRSPLEKKPDAPSRGMLAANYLVSELTPQKYIQEIASSATRYNGFNLLIGDRQQMIWFTNSSTEDPRNGKPLPPGVYGLSNGELDTPWPKVVRTKAQFGSLLCQNAPEDAFFEMLTDTSRASDCRLPKTGLSIEWERTLSSIFIESPQYGTRTSTMVQVWAEREPVLREKTFR